MKQISKITLLVSNQFENIRKVFIDKPLTPEQKTHEQPSLCADPQTNKSILKRLSDSVFKIFSKKITTGHHTVFTTALTSLMTQPLWRRMMLTSTTIHEQFVTTAQHLAKKYGVHLELATVEDLERESSQSACLQKLAKRIHLIGKDKIQNVTASLLDELPKPPITSTLKITYETGESTFEFTTRYAKYKIQSLHPSSGLVDFTCQQNQETCSLSTQENILPDHRGVVGQRILWTGEQQLASYSGELNTTYHILEQVLCSLGITSSPVTLTQASAVQEERCMLFTSLYSWTDLERIVQQYRAVESLNGKVVTLPEASYQLRLLYLNVPLSLWSKLPSPGETGAVLQDMNDQTWIWLTHQCAQRLRIPTDSLEKWNQKLDRTHSDFFRHEQQRLTVIDAFRLYLLDLLPYLSTRSDHLSQVLYALLSQKRPDKKKLRGLDYLIYLNHLVKELNLLQHKNCEHALYRSAAAKAADQAQFVVEQLTQEPMMPGLSPPQHLQLFETLYSLYLLKEEPHVHQLMATGDASTFQKKVIKNPEIRRYLQV